MKITKKEYSISIKTKDLFETQKDVLNFVKTLKIKLPKKAFKAKLKHIELHKKGFDFFKLFMHN